MKRPIKFRAYNKKWGMMSPPEDIEKIIFDEEVGAVEIIFNITTTDGQRNSGNEWVIEDSGDVVLMQFTGLHDKNGKEIYEGDIIQPVEGLPSEVFWWEDHARYACRNAKNLNFPFYLVKQQEIEIIGNIYEKETNSSK